MCRVLAYLGPSVSIEDLLLTPDSSLVRQVVNPQMMGMLNLGGFGLMAWDADSHRPDEPFEFRIPNLPTFDRNLKNLSQKVRCTGLLAHVRGVVYQAQDIAQLNLHPFRFPGAPFAMAMNGDLDRFPEMRYEMADAVDDRWRRCVQGTTDTEMLYALILSRLPGDANGQAGPEDVGEAVRKALEDVRAMRALRGIDTQSAANLVLSDGRWMVATRFTYDYGWYPAEESFFAAERRHDFLSMWVTKGNGYGLHDGSWGMGADEPVDSLVVASEPLTAEAVSWYEVPAYSITYAERNGNGSLDLETRELAA